MITVSREMSEMDNPSEMVIHEHRDYTGSKVGMWLFLLTEIILFGGMFLLYSVYRSRHGASFHHAAEELEVALGVVNTLILLTSSLTMALSIAAVQKGKDRHSIAFLAATIFLAVLFLVNKYFEWGAKIEHGIYPGSPDLISRGEGEVLFFGLYYVMTGIHGLHVLAGIVLLSIMLVLVYRGKIDRNDFVKLENSGLYWHLVDIIWIYLFPLFYLIS
jgi:cytochrome c oxidase subunit 3